MKKSKMLPVGFENFQQVIESGFYYVDKTKLIEQLLENWSAVNLFTRPRRFGKTLNMSMLKYFFEAGTDKSLFNGLYISNNKELCEEYMGKYPVIFLTLKGVEGLTFEKAKKDLIQLIGDEASRFKFLLTSDKLDEFEKEQYLGFLRIKDGSYCIEENVLTSSLKLLSKLLYHHYGKKAIILIDEYDVPLDKAFNYGYYREMVSLMRVFLGNALKTNDSLQFAVLTGCLRVSKESIFTGLNNFKVFSIDDKYYDEEFGFTNEEVKKLLEDYNLQDNFPKVKEWYDGYRFGEAEIYCPWDVINYVYDCINNSTTEPKAYWINSSGNDLVKRFIAKANKSTQREIEQLVEGNAIKKFIRLDLTYDEIDNSIDNLWSVLFTTGYLTQCGKAENGVYKLIIPNKEIREVFVLKIQEWFNEKVDAEPAKIDSLCEAFVSEDVETIQMLLNEWLWKSISIRDTAARNDRKENFYHGFLLGLLSKQDDWIVESNSENGVGYSDISIILPSRKGIIIELKYANDGNLEEACKDALNQIKDNKYAEGLKKEDVEQVVSYGIAFNKKKCMVVKA